MLYSFFPLPAPHSALSLSLSLQNACKSYIYALIMTQKLPFELCFQAIYVHNTPFMRPFTILIATALTFQNQAGLFRTIYEDFHSKIFNSLPA